MPGQMMHLYVGDLFWKNRGLTGNRGQFLLGCIAPDGVNARGFAPKQQRWHAHLRDQNLEVWKKNALHFYQDHLDFPDLDYLQGYLVHVFTDILWLSLIHIFGFCMISNLRWIVYRSIISPIFRKESPESFFSEIPQRIRRNFP